MKKSWRWCGLLIMAVCFFISCPVKAETITYDISAMEPFKSRTPKEIAEDYESVINASTGYTDGSSDTYYETVPSLESPYAGGELKQSTHQAMTDMTNFYRRLIGVSEIAQVSTHSDDLQVGAVCRKFQFAHQLSSSYKPEDMSDDFWNQGANAAHNILASGFTPRGSITGWLDEGYSLKDESFDTVGHRQMLLSYRTSGFDFGYAGRVGIGLRTQTKGTTDLPYVAFPAAGYCINNKIGSSYSAWTIELNSAVFKSLTLSDLMVTVENETTGETYTCSTATNTLMYANYYGTIAFKQPALDNSVYTDNYRVTMTGLQDANGDDAVITYEVKFFDYRDYVPSEVKSVSVSDTYGNYQISSSYATTENLSALGKVLPSSVTVKAENGHTCVVPLKGEWVLDEENTCWVNSVDETQLPDTFIDANGLLEKVSISYKKGNGGSMGISPSSCVEGQSGQISIGFYMLNSTYNSLYQITSDGDVVKRCDETSDNYSKIMGSRYLEGGTFTFDKYSCSDTGTYFAIYSYSKTGTAYVTPFRSLTVNPRVVSSIELSSSVYNTYLTGENIKLNEAELTVTYNDDSTETVSVAEDMISDFSTENIGEKQATITYEGKTTKFSYLVVSKPSDVTAVYGDTLENVELPSVEGGKYVFTDASDVTVGNAGKNTFDVKFVPDDTQYKEIEGQQISIVVSKAEPDYEIPAGLTAVYGDTLKDIVLPASDLGTFVFEGDPDTSVGNAGTHTFSLRFVPEDTDNYNEVTGIEVTVVVNKAKASAPVPPTLEKISYRSGNTLAAIILPAGWSWNNPETVPTVLNDGYAMTYTPSEEEQANYDYTGVKLTFVVALTVEKATNAPDMPNAILSVANTVKKVSEITLPAGWSWENGKDDLISAGGTVRKTAVYEDTDNYTNYSVEIQITRAACDIEHKQFVVDKKETCTENGAGHNVCPLCGDVLEDNLVIEATGHDLTKSVRKEATCTTDGQEEYWSCSRCNKMFTNEEGTTEAVLEQLVIPAKGHEYVDGICVNCGEKESFTADGFTFTMIPDAGNVEDDAKHVVSIKVAENTDLSGECKIPETIEKEGIVYTVSVIEENAFSGCENLTSVTIPETVTQIGEGAFADCHKLKTVTFESSKAPQIADTIFEGVPYDLTIKIPENADGYNNCNALQDRNLVVMKEPDTNISRPIPSNGLVETKKVKVSRMTLTGISGQIAAGKKIKLTAEIYPESAVNKAVRWTSSNPKVATVTQTGIVTMKSKTGGKSVIITATATDGSGVSASWKIKSMKGVVKKITLGGAKKVKAGKSIKLKLKVTATNDANKKVKWLSSNTSYATVSASGKVKTSKAGKGEIVKITAMATDGSNKKKTVTIKIK